MSAKTTIDKTQVALLIATAAFAAAGVIAPYWLCFLTMLALAKALVVQGVVIQMRLGLVSFGQGLFFGIGGYAVGIASNFWGISDAFVLLALALAAAVAVAAVLGLLMARYRDIFFAMLSLALSMILFGVLVKSQGLGSTDGFNVPAQSYLGWVPAPGQQKLVAYVLTIAVVGTVALLLCRYLGSGAGQIAEAVRENEIRVEYLGLSPRWLIYASYVMAAGVAALGGALTAFATGHVDPEMAYWATSGEFVFIALLGGTAHVAAPFLASILFSVVRTYAFEYTPHTWQLILGLVLLAIIVFLPKGLWSLVQREGKVRA
ncbi:MAG: branched-chain amino acid ABC transporter permease [Azospirillum sp.]|nr:branched-chain amino acid ABC transporter permease [Azospirillum sp.]